MTNYKKMLKDSDEWFSIERAVEAFCRNGEKPCVFCGKKCCGDCREGVKAWLLKEVEEDG
jgi:hypothetical protein